MTGGSNRDLRSVQNSQEVKDALGALLTGRQGYRIADSEPRYRSCPGCKQRITETTKFCQYCGTQVQKKPELQRPTNCQKCKAKLALDQNFCTECGTKIEAMATNF